MRILVAPDSFKGSLTSVEVARALADGWSHGRPRDEMRLVPLADGGEGTIEAVDAADAGWVAFPAHARDPLGRFLRGRFLRRGDAAIVELATASGLSRLTPEERDPMASSTFGTGLILAAAIGLGARDVVLGVGGSASTDGGAGLLTALGARFLDSSGVDLVAGGGALADLATVSLDELSHLLSEVRLTVGSDVTNPLLGERGAAATYGPQKGANPAQVAELEANLTRYADMLEAACGRRVRDVPGAGAAGGTVAGLLSVADRFASFEIRPGVELLMELTRFDEALATADLVLTGEGQVDEQTGFGKTALGVARRAHDARVSCICFGGGVTPEGIAALAPLRAVVVPVAEGGGQTVEEQMAAGTAPLKRAAERAARLLSIGSADADF